MNSFRRILWALLLSLVFGPGCGSDVTIDSVNLCRCQPDEICVNDACVRVTDTLVLDGSGGETTSSPVCSAGPVVINEFRYAGASRPDFVELLGQPGEALDGYRLLATSGDSIRRFEVVLSGELDSSGLFVGAFGDSLESTADQLLGVEGFPAPNGNIQLFDCHGRRQDSVGYGTFGPEETFRGEGSPVAGSGADLALARCPGALDVIDSGDNASDFVVDAASPGAANERISDSPACTPCETLAVAGEVWLGEVLYDPPGADEGSTAFVELRGVPKLSLEGVWLESWDEEVGLWNVLTDVGRTLDAEGVFLIAEDSSLSNDLVLETVDASNDSGAFRLVGCSGEVFDVIAWGTPADPAAMGLLADQISADVGDGRSLARCPDGAVRVEVGDAVDSEPSPGVENPCP
ncbi:MAG: hypothetical protein CO108_18925 [Deltaproteobacteria bacterium CG_4_9_14_3_um_filter_63_12]|nr:MAG: hypothetical protein CO108_18925 [Deltaproteobacteria bacterium CG_4_9_14_3_um_filter_63_12]